MPFTINQLSKTINRTYTPARLGYPGSPGSPYRPAHWANVKTKVCGYSYEDASGGLGYSSDVELSRLGDTGSLTTVAGSPTYGCKTVTTRVFLQEQPYVPPVPPMPATKESTVMDYQLGWNARSRSIQSMADNGSFKFRVPRDTQGAIVGLSAEPKNLGYNDIAYGFYVSSGVVKIMEAGKEIADLGAWPNASLKLTRLNGRILYDINGVVVRDRPNTPAPLYLTAALYVGGDTVEDAELSGIAAAYGSFPAMNGIAGNVTLSQAVGSFSPMTGESGSYATGSASGSFVPMYGAVADASGYAFSSGAFQPMNGSAEAFDLVPEYAFSDGDFNPMIGAAQGVMHIVGEAQGSFKAMTGLSSNYAYSEARGSFAPMRGIADATELPNQATIFGAIYPFNSITASQFLFAVIDANMNITNVFTLTVSAQALINGTFSLDDEFTLTSTLTAAIQSLMSAGASTFDSQNAALRDVWVYHMDAAGSTRYTEYDFTGFSKVGQSYYGVKPDGIYLLEGADDNGKKVTARVNFGNLSFGTMNRKALPYVYVGMASSGKTYLKVIADGATYTYAVRDSTELMKSHRFELGRGLRASFYDLELVSDGQVFDLHNIDFQPIELKRSL